MSATVRLADARFREQIDVNGLRLLRSLGVEGRDPLQYVFTAALGALFTMAVVLRDTLGDIETLTAFLALERVIRHSPNHPEPGKAIINQL